jgi:hypothetical protein
MHRSILKWELIGIPIILIVGALLHFTFDWANRLRLVGAVAAVNESVWEHFKLAFWPALIYAIFEYIFFKKFVKNFAFAKAVGIYAMPITIAIIFYSYTAIVGHEILAVDISSFVVAVAVGQLISYQIIKMRQLPSRLNVFGVILLIILGTAIVVFTFFTPHLPIFRDGPSGNYGIL